MATVEQTALLYFQGKGLTKAQAAGIVGNLKQESSLNVKEPGGGLDQGQGARDHSSEDLEGQLDSIWTELASSELGTLRDLQKASTPSQAAVIFSKEFERPSEPDLPNREKYAEEAFAGASTIDAGFSPEDLAKDLGEGPLGAGKLFGETLGEAGAELGKGETGNPLGAITGELSAAAIVAEWLSEPLRIVKLLGGGILVIMGLHTLTTGGALGAGGQARSSLTAVPTAAHAGTLKLARRAAEAAAA